MDRTKVSSPSGWQNATRLPGDDGYIPKKVNSNDPLETAMVGAMNHFSTTNQNLGSLVTAVESNQNRNKDHDIWASRIGTESAFDKRR